MDAWRFATHLKTVQVRMAAGLGPWLRARGLSLSALPMLASVERHPHPTELAQVIGLPAPTVSRLLKTLETQGYLERETVPEDLRRYRFRLTSAGRALHAEARRRVERVLEAMLARLTPSEREELDRLLGALAAPEEGEIVGGGEPSPPSSPPANA